MALTKAEYRSAVRDLLDDPDAKFWTDSSLDRLIELVLDDLWGEILDQAPYIVSQYQQISLPLTAPGYVDLRQTVYGGNLTQRLYRVQQVIADGRQYLCKDPRDYLMIATGSTVSTIAADQGVEQRYSFQFLGNQMWLHPLGQLTTKVEIRYNYKPVRFTQLTDGYTVEMPEGSEQAGIQISAATAMIKGNREDAKQMFEVAGMAKDKLMNSIRRQFHGMTQPWAASNPTEWGGT